MNLGPRLSGKESVALRAELRAFRERSGLGYLHIANATGLSYPAIHYIQSGRRRRPSIVCADRIRQFMATYHIAEVPVRAHMGHVLDETAATTKSSAPEEFVETRAARTVMNALNYCARKHQNGAVFGHPGVGKSHALRAWSARTRYAHCIVFCRAYTSYSKLVRAIAGAMGLGQEGGTSALDEAIHEELARSPRLLILDEADMLPARALDWLRSIWDESGKQSSFMLLAKPAFQSRLQTAHLRSSQDLTQLWSRILFRAAVEGITREESAAVLAQRGFAGKIEAPAAEALYSAADGSFRELEMLLTLAEILLEENPKLNGRITEAVIEKAQAQRFGAAIARAPRRSS